MSLVITGNPGVGKHTVGKKIAEIFDLHLLDLNKLSLESGIYEQKEETRDVDISKLKEIIKDQLTKKTIVVGHLAPYVLTKTQVKVAVILRKSPYKLYSVYKKRSYSERKIKENLESEILGVIAHDTIKKLGKTKTVQIDTTEKSIQTIVTKIKSIIVGKKNNDMVDWLELVIQNNDLQKFFSY